MADPRFYSVAGPFTLKEISEISGAETAGDAVPETLYTDVAPLDRATKNHVSFLDNRRYTDSFLAERGGSLLGRASPRRQGSRGDGLAFDGRALPGIRRGGALLSPARKTGARCRPVGERR